MGENSNRLGDVYVTGVREFVKYARRNLGDDLISCPCTHCRNGKNCHWEEVEVHLIKWGMQQDYLLWKYHGEIKIPFIPDQIPVNEPFHKEGDPQRHSTLNDLIHDAYGLHVNQPNQSLEVDNGCKVEDLNQDKDYIKLKDAASRPFTFVS